jgi:hypothetical protein
MPLKPIPFRKRVAVVLLGVLVFVGMALLYYGLRFGFTPAAKLLIPMAYLVLVVFLLKTSGVSIPDRYRHRSLLGGRINVLDLAKSFGCFCASLVWVALVIRLVSDTPAGATAVFAPALVFLGASAVFFWRSFSRPSF